MHDSIRSRLSKLMPDPAPVRERLRRTLPRLKAHARLVRRRLQPSSNVSLVDRLDEIDPTFVEEGARAVSETDIATVIEEADAIEERFRDSGPLRRLLDDGRLLLSLVGDTWQGHYRNVPWWTLSGAVFALLYVLNPLDLIPDALPAIGVLDDAAVVSAALALLEQDLHDYRQWCLEQDAETNISTENAEKLTSG